MDVRATGERLQERPLRPGEILEAVGEDGPAVPRLELPLHPLHRVAALEVAVPQAEPCELVAVAGVEAGEVALDVGGLDEAGLELRDGAEQRVAEAGEACRGAQPVQARAREDPPDDERALGVRGDLAPLPVSARDPLEEVVERADGPAQERRTARQQVALHAIDFRPVRDHEIRLAVEVLQVAIEEPRDFPGVRRANQQRQRHRCSLDARAETTDARPETTAPTLGTRPGVQRPERGR